MKKLFDSSESRFEGISLEDFLRTNRIENASTSQGVTSFMHKGAKTSFYPVKGLGYFQEYSGMNNRTCLYLYDDRTEWLNNLYAMLEQINLEEI